MNYTGNGVSDCQFSMNEIYFSFKMSPSYENGNNRRRNEKNNQVLGNNLYKKHQMFDDVS